MWDQENYIKAWTYAAKAHNTQCVPDTDIPYIHHIGLVTMEVMGAITSDNRIASPNLLITCALLHDTIEDTNTSYKDIETEFGSQVANGVLALSKDEKLLNKQDKMRDSLQRIQQEPKEIWMVKLADRITNLRKPPAYWSQEKIVNYQKEAQEILAALGEASTFLADRLHLKILDYQRYVNT